MALVEMQIDGPVAVMVLNRPARRNAVDGEMTAALKAALARLENEPALRVGILTGAGGFFCAGMDLAAFADGDLPGLKEPDRFAGFTGAERTRPVIAAVEGGALAGGFELVLACDMATAARDAIFGLPEVRRGLFPAAGGAFRLPRRIPLALANEMVLTGRPIPAVRAAELGLLNSVTEPGLALDAARALAHEIAANAPLAVAASLALSLAASRAGEADLWALNDRLFQRVERSQNASEGALSFAEKRPPRWQGR